MSIEIPAGWEPPKKIVGGENNFELCAIRLYDQVAVMLSTRSRNFDLPIVAESDRYLREKDRMIESMKQKGVYFHEPDGSVFMDYKIMRELASKQDGWENIEAQFKPEMSTDEAMQLARSIVANWNWEQEQS